MSWFDWEGLDKALFDYVRRCIALRQRARSRSLAVQNGGAHRLVLELSGEVRLRWLINATAEATELPLAATDWQWRLDTATETGPPQLDGGHYRLAPWSMAVFERR